jgi:hypothetical protein
MRQTATSPTSSVRADERPVGPGSDSGLLNGVNFGAAGQQYLLDQVGATRTVLVAQVLAALG